MCIRDSIQALPSPVRAEQPSMDSWPSVDRSLDEMVVIVGLGEVGPWGSGRTRFEAEYGIQYDGTVDLTAAGVLELAWMTGLLTWRDTPVAGWYDSDGTVVDESEIFDRFHDEVVARSGVRSFVDDMAIDELTSLEQVDMFLDRDVTFGVEDEAAARSYVESDPNFTTAWQDHGEWKITRVKVRGPGSRGRRRSPVWWVDSSRPTSTRRDGAFLLRWSSRSIGSPCGTSLPRWTPTCRRVSLRPKFSKRY